MIRVEMFFLLQAIDFIDQHNSVFTIMPISPIIPMIAIKVKGCRNSNRAGVMPQKTNGKQSK